MKKRVLTSLLVFSVFALVGPLIWTACPQSVRYGCGRLSREIFGLIVLTFPTILFSAGEPTPSVVSLAEANIVFFVLIGALVGLVPPRAMYMVLMYLAMCALVAGLGGYYARFRLSEFRWPAFGAALLLYAIPFRAVFWTATGPRLRSTGGMVTERKT